MPSGAVHDRSATSDGFAIAVSLRAAKDDTQIQYAALNTYICTVQPFIAYVDNKALRCHVGC